MNVQRGVTILTVTVSKSFQQVVRGRVMLILAAYLDMGRTRNAQSKWHTDDSLHAQLSVCFKQFYMVLSLDW